MLLLAIDTSTSAITVALRGEGLATAATVLDARGHTEHLAPLVTEVLESAERTPADVTDVAVGTGPGPFTGLRVGIVTALVFGHARGVPVHGVCSLDALAFDAAALMGEGEFLVATDARRKEVYWARYAVGNTRCAVGAIGDAEQESVRSRRVQRHDVLARPAVAPEHQRIVVHEHAAGMLNPRAGDGVADSHMLLDRHGVLALHRHERRRVGGLRVQARPNTDS